MMKRQMKRDDKGDANGPSSGPDNSSSAGQNEVSSKTSSDSGTGDKTVSSSSTSCSKNIFEQFDTEMVERRSPRRRSASPRVSLSSTSSVQENTPSRSGSEEKQQLSIASAVKALRGISEKVSEGRSRKHARGESAPGKHSREGSPRTSSPRRQSPRRSGEKMSPPDASLKAPKTKKSPSTPPSSDSVESSPRGGKRVHSPRRLSPEMTAGPPAAQQKPCGSQGDSSPQASDRKNTMSSSSKSTDREEHIIHILSSTSRLHGAKVVQVDAKSPVTSKALRQLFVNTCPESGNLEEKTKMSSRPDSGRTSVDCANRNSAVGSCPPLASRSTDSVQHDSTKPEDVESSLLCAMLVGGSEVTKNYEQSREQNTHSNTAQHVHEGSPSPSTSRPCVNDSFFEDDSLLDIPETKPFELPVLSQLPPLLQPNVAVLELTKTEKQPPEERFSLNKPLTGHTNKTSSLLNLISKVKDYLQLTDDSEDKNAQSEVSPSESGSLESLQSSPTKRNGYTVMSSTSVGSDTELLRSKSAESLHTSSQGDGLTSDTDDSPKSSRNNSSSAAGSVRSDLSVSCTSSQSEARDLRVNSESCPEKSQRSGSQSCAEDIPKDSKSDSIQSVKEEVVPNGNVPSSKSLDVPGSNAFPKTSRECNPEGPASPNSLGELDATEITKAANQAVHSRVAGKSDRLSEPGTSHSDNSQNLAAIIKTESLAAQASTWQPPPSEKSRVSRPPARDPFDHSIVSTLTTIRACTSSIPSTSICQPKLPSHISGPDLMKTRWQPKVQPSEGRHRWSKSHEVVNPSPLEILQRPVRNTTPTKSSAFLSRDLDHYLHNPANKVVIPASKDSKLASAVFDQGKYKTYEELQQVLRKAQALEKEGSDCEEMLAKSDEEEDEHDDEKDVEISKKVDPDFDVLDGLVFASFETEMAMQAHMTVEKVLKWDREPMAFVNIAKFRAFEESRRCEGNIRRESQGLRGVHMKWRKYQRLYRRELKTIHEENGIPWVYGKVLEKTSDITKLKNWRKKFGEMKTEDRPEIPQEDTQQKVKRKRKTYVFSTKKKYKRVSASADKSSEPASLEASFEDVKNEDHDDAEDFDTSQEILEEAEYGHPIPLDEDDYMEDVQNSLVEMTMKKHGLRNTKGIFSRFNMGPEDRHIFKKLGGWVTRLRMYRRLPNNRASGSSSKSSPDSPDKDRKHKNKKYLKPSFWLPLITSSMANQALSALQLSTISGCREMRVSSGSNDLSQLSGGGEYVDPAAEDNSPDSKAKEACDKPGCRYGCICHLCQPSGESDEQEQTTPAVSQKRSCDKEYCRLGCICDSLEKSSQHSTADHCRKPECVLQCQCKPAAQAEDVQPLPKEQDTSKTTHPEKPVPIKAECVDAADSSGDELPTLEKTTARRQRSTDRYSNLPRRQTSYRVAKNLDAVSRKAMMLYETSEIYWEQSSNRRKKSTDLNTASPPRTPAASSTLSSSPFMPLSKTTIAGDSSTTTTATLQSSTPVTSNLESTACQTLPVASLLPTGVMTVGADAQMQQSAKGMPRGLVENDMSSTGDAGKSSHVHPEHEDHFSAVLISDDDSSGSTQKTLDPKFESKRSRLKRKIFSTERDTDVAPGSVPPTTTKNNNTSSTVATPPVSPPVPGQQFPLSMAEKFASSTFQNSRWHTSMVCLKANPVMKPKDANKNSGSDDVQEEDEIKLLEFISNCNWDSTKREILYRVAGCLTRGHYPSPRVVLVGDFRVEILPKAQKPSVIPPELRNRLPEMMYSIRVRVTQFQNFQQSAVPVSLVKNSATVGLALTATPGMIVTPGTAPSSSLKGTASATGVPVGTAAPSAEAKTSSSVGISGLGRLQILQNRPVSVSEIQAAQMESFCFQAKKMDGADKADTQAGGDEQAVKKNKKKKKKAQEQNLTPGAGKPAKGGADDKSKPGDKPKQVASTQQSSTTQDVTGEAKKPSVFTAATRLNTPHVVPVGKAPMSAAAGKTQFLGLPAGNLGDIKFIQFPGQSGILQLVPASAFGLKTLPDGKGVPNYVAVPLLTPVGMPGKKLGTNTQADPAAAAAAAAGGIPLQGPMILTNFKPVTSVSSAAGDAADFSGEPPVKKKKKKKRKKLTPDGETPLSADTSAMNVTTLSLASALRDLRVTPFQTTRQDTSSASAGPQAKDTAAGGNLKNTTAGPLQLTDPKLPAPGLTASSTDSNASIVHHAGVLTGRPIGIPGTTTVSGKIDAPHIGKIPDDSKSSVLSSDPDSGLDSTMSSTSGNTLEIKQTDGRGSSSQVVVRRGARTGMGKCPTTSTPSLGIAGPCLPASQLPVPPGVPSSMQPYIYPVHLVKNNLANQDNSLDSSSSFSDDDDEFSLSEDEAGGEVNSEKQQSAHCPHCRSSSVEGKIVKVCSFCNNSGKPKSRGHGERKRRRRARISEKLHYLQHILYSADPNFKMSPERIPKEKLLTKAAHVVRYQQKRSLSLKKGVSVESQRNAMLQQRLKVEIDSLHKEGISEEAISAVLSSVTLPSLPQIASRHQMSIGEKELLHTEQDSPGPAVTEPLTPSSSLPSGHLVTRMSPWPVEAVSRLKGSSAVQDGVANAAPALSPSSAGQLPNQNSSKRRKTNKPTRYCKASKDSEFVIEIEQAEEDVHFFDGEASDDVPLEKRDNNLNAGVVEERVTRDAPQKMRGRNQKIVEVGHRKDARSRGGDSKLSSLKQLEKEKDRCESPVYPPLADFSAHTNKADQTGTSSIKVSSTSDNTNTGGQTVEGATSSTCNDPTSEQEHTLAQNHDTENDRNPEKESGVPVIMSVTSLQNSDTGFGDDDVGISSQQDVEAPMELKNLTV